MTIEDIVKDKYEILKEIGRGGTAIVYLAYNIKSNKQLVIKEILKERMCRDTLIAEANLLKRTSHPSLPKVFDIIETDKYLYIFMDYLDGEPLNKVLMVYGAQPQELVIEWAKQLCDVIGYLHSLKPAIIYRDMKPSNIMLRPNGRITLIDFGTAREYKNGKLDDTAPLGTRGYAAPEQYGGRGQTDARTDIFGIGTTLYHLVTGKNPAEPPYELYPIRQWDPELSSGLEEIIQKCTQLDPKNRYQNCSELMYALEHYTTLNRDDRLKLSKKAGDFFITFCCSSLLIIIGVIVFAKYKNLYPLYVAGILLILSIYLFYKYKITYIIKVLLGGSEKNGEDKIGHKSLRFNEQFISEGKPIAITPIQRWQDETTFLQTELLSPNEENKLRILKDSKLIDMPKITVFLSYCSADSDLADIIDEFLNQYVYISVSRYTRNVGYKMSFKQFMNSLSEHDFVILIITDKYLKSRACLYEINELISDRDYSKKIIFIIVNENDKKYYKEEISTNLFANIYSFEGRLSYTHYWENEYERYYNKTELIKSENAKIEAFKELREIRRIIDNDIGPFLEYISDAKGMSFDEMYTSGFIDILNELSLTNISND